MTKQYLTPEIVSEMTKEEIFKLMMKRPGHPGQYGFMLSVDAVGSVDNLAPVMFALMDRLKGIEDVAGKYRKKRLEKERSGKTECIHDFCRSGGFAQYSPKSRGERIFLANHRAGGWF